MNEINELRNSKRRWRIPYSDFFITIEVTVEPKIATPKPKPITVPKPHLNLPKPKSPSPHFSFSFLGSENKPIRKPEGWRSFFKGLFKTTQGD